MHQAGQGVGDLAAVGAQFGRAGAPPVLDRLEQGVDHGWQHGDSSRGAGAGQGGVEDGAFHGLQGVAKGGFSQGGQQAHAPLGDLRLPGGVLDAFRARTCVDRVEPGRPAYPQFNDLAPHRPGYRRPLPFGVAGHVDPPAEGDAAGGQGLGQGGLAPTDLSGQEHVRVGQHPPLVKDPRVIAEPGARPGVLADQDASRAQPLLSQERVGPGQHLAGGPVRREAQWPPGAPRCGPGWPRAGRDGDRRRSSRAASARARRSAVSRRRASTSTWRAARSWARSAPGWARGT